MLNFPYCLYHFVPPSLSYRSQQVHFRVLIFKYLCYTLSASFLFCFDQYVIYMAIEWWKCSLFKRIRLVGINIL
uniref:Putative ovule protein n=1 Tax=Solanum chacoense TaxID=4108 RepID=A0A0V0HAD9_SOLCH